MFNQDHTKTEMIKTVSQKLHFHTLTSLNVAEIKETLVEMHQGCKFMLS